MTGITNSLRIAVSGLQLAQDGLATTSNNVSNANTEGYSRKTIEQAAHIIDGRGSGVREIGISRTVDNFLELQIRMQQAQLGRTETISAYLDDVQGMVFGNPTDGATGLPSFVDDFAEALEAAAAEPEKSAQRAGLTWTAADLFRQIDDAAQTVHMLRRDADRRINGLVTEINTAVQSLHQLNLDIARAKDDAELLDQRDMLVKELSYKLDVRTYTDERGALSVFTSDGQPLLENEPSLMVYDPAATVGRNTPFPPIKVYDPSQLDPGTGEPFPTSQGRELVGSGIRHELTPELLAAQVTDPSIQAIDPTVEGGQLGGLLAVRDRELPELDDQLAEFALLLSHALNAAHNGANQLPPPGQLTGSREVTALTPDSVDGTAYIQAVDLADPTNEVTIAVDLTTVHAAAVTLATAATSPADWPDHFAAALAQEINAQFAGGEATADASGASFELDAQAGWGLALAEGTSAIQQTDDKGHVMTYGLSHFLGLNDLVAVEVGDQTGLSVRADIAADPSKVASAKLDVAPDGGGGFTGQLGSVGDNRGLNELAAALETPLTSVSRGDLPSAHLTTREYLSDVINVHAIKAETASRAARTDTILADELDYQRAGISGVNLDEEMAHLIQLQQAYATSARLVTAADEMLQELLSIKR